MPTRKRFKEYARQEPLSESSWLSKGFSIGQANKFESTKRQLDSLTQQIDSACDRGRLESDQERKIDYLLGAVSLLAKCFKLNGEMSKSTINVAVASNLLDDNIHDLLKRK